jgi:hypothetical protein
VALAILVVAMGGVLLVFERSMRWAREARLAAAADARLREAVERLSASPAPRETGGPAIWEPGTRSEGSIPLQTNAGEPPLATGALTTHITDVRRDHDGRALRFRAARLDLQYQFRGRTQTQRREIVRAFDP